MNLFYLGAVAGCDLIIGPGAYVFYFFVLFHYVWFLCAHRVLHSCGKICHRGTKKFVTWKSIGPLFSTGGKIYYIKLIATETHLNTCIQILSLDGNQIEERNDFKSSFLKFWQIAGYFYQSHLVPANTFDRSAEFDIEGREIWAERKMIVHDFSSEHEAIVTHISVSHF